MIIAQLSDTHILARSSGQDQGASRTDNLRRCIADINHQGVDAVIHTGDSVHHGAAEEYAHLREILAELEVPLFITPGNRDRHGELRAALSGLTYLPRDSEHFHYAVDDYPVRLVALDSVEPGERKGVFCSQRLAWLEETLAREPAKRTILFMHHPPFDITPQYVDGYRRPQEAADLTALVRRHPQIERLLCGHVHCLHHEPWGGTTATVMPSIALDLRKGLNAATETSPSYLLHMVSRDCVVTRERVVSR